MKTVPVVLVALVAWSCWLRWGVLAASPYPIGVDGYFYPIQVRALLEHGVLQYPASPLTFWWMAPFAAVTDPIMGAKIGAALGGALIALPAYGVGARVGGGRGAGLIAAAIATTSAGSAYLTIEFVKQGIGLTVALTALWLVLRALETPGLGRMCAAGGGVIAAALAHKMAAGIVVAIALPALIAELHARGLLGGRRPIYLAGAAVAAGGVALCAGIVAPQRFVSPADLELLGQLFAGHARWDAPALVTPNQTLAFGHEAAIGGVLAVVAAAVLVGARWVPWLRVERTPAERAAAYGFVVLALVIAVPWLAVTDPQGLAYRLRVAAFVPMAIAAAIAAGALSSRFSGTPADEPQPAIKPAKPSPSEARIAKAARIFAFTTRDAVLAAIALALVARAPTERTEGQVLAHPALVAAVMAATEQVPAGATLIVPERHIAFMAAWYTRAPISLRPEAVPYAHRVRLMPLAFIGAGSPLDHALDDARLDLSIPPPIGLHPRHRNGLVLVTEPTWDWLLARLPPRARERWGAWPTI